MKQTVHVTHCNGTYTVTGMDRQVLLTTTSNLTLCDWLHSKGAVQQGLDYYEITL